MKLIYRINAWLDNLLFESGFGDRAVRGADLALKCAVVAFAFFLVWNVCIAFACGAVDQVVR